MEDYNIDWDEYKQAMKKLVKMEKDENSRVIKMYIQREVDKDQLMEQMFGGEDQLKKTITQFTPNGKPIDYEVEYVEDENLVLFKFADEDMADMVYNLLNQLFFGDFAQQLLEMLGDAFKA